MNIKNKALTLATVGLILQGCGADERDRPVPQVTSTALFQPSLQQAALVPFPTNLLFNGTTDGSINISGKVNSNNAAEPLAAALADPQTALNTMDGFSTTAAMVVRFSDEVDSDTVSAGIRIFEGGTVDAASKTVQVVGRELTYGIDFVASISQGKTGLILPLKPLESGATYIVAVTDALRTTTGQPVEADPEYLLYKGDTSLSGGPYASLEPLRLQTNAHEDAIVSFTTGDVSTANDLDYADIVLSYGVSTQNIGSALIAAKTVVNTVGAGDMTGPMGGNLIAATASPGGAATVYTGVLSGLTQFLDPADQNNSIWLGDPAAWANAAVIGAGAAAACSGAFGADGTAKDNLVPCNGYTPEVVTTSHAIPVLVSVPANADTACTATGMPIVIFQHGITANRGSLLGLADALANTCAVGIAIDLPKHGILPSDATFGALSFGSAERLVPSVAPSGTDPLGDCGQAQPVENPGSPGTYQCPSGDNFINLTNLANARDGLRQGVVDLHSLYLALTNGALTEAEVGLSTATLDTSNIHFVGMSLGGIVGMPFVAQEDGIETAMLNVTGGGIAKLLDGSASFEPVITAGLSQAGVNKPSGDYEGFMIIAQTLVDNTDPINFTQEIRAAEENPLYWAGAAAAAGTERPLLMQEVVGAGDYLNCFVEGDACPENERPDQVIPNNVLNPTLAQAWGAVSGSGQVGYLPGQNVITTPSALAGTDPLAQGTAYVSLAQLGALGDPLTDFGVGAFFGLGLAEVDSVGCSGCSGLVRFTSGVHSSLLNPTADPAVTTVMQTQIATFIGSYLASGGASTSIAGDSGAGVVRD